MRRISTSPTISSTLGPLACDGRADGVAVGVPAFEQHDGAADRERGVGLVHRGGVHERRGEQRHERRAASPPAARRRRRAGRASRSASRPAARTRRSSPYPSSVPWCQSTPFGQPGGAARVPEEEVVARPFDARCRLVRARGAPRTRSRRASSSTSTMWRRRGMRSRRAVDPVARATGGTRAPRRRRCRRAARARRRGSGSSRWPAPRAASTARTGTPCTRGSCAGRARPWCRGRRRSVGERRGQARGAVLDLART